MTAGHLAWAQGSVDHADLAVRGRLLGQVLDQQLPAALAAGPDLPSLVAGGNDLLRPGADPDALAAMLEEAVAEVRSTGADVLLATEPPVARRARIAAEAAWVRSFRGALGRTAAARPVLNWGHSLERPQLRRMTAD